MIVKIRIKKERIDNDKQTKYVYPKNYDVKKFSPFIYQNEGLEYEYCLAHVIGEFSNFSEDFIEITKAEAKEILKTWIDTDKDLKAELKEEAKSKKLKHV